VLGVCHTSKGSRVHLCQVVRNFDAFVIQRTYPRTSVPKTDERAAGDG
jgi:hypothetical protein